MNSQLDQFCALFPNENVLQDHLVELLSRLEGISGVRKLQGANERGKDIIFYHEGPFGRKRLNACVVKNTTISGSVSSQSGARTVLFQAQQAFDTPYVNPTGADERVEHVFVISPQATSPDAIDSIKGGLQQRSGQVTFLCGSDLLDVFKTTWPELLAFEGDFLARYLNDLRLQLDTNPVMSALVLRHSIVEPAAQVLTEIYVPQRLLVQLCEFKPKTLSWYKDLLSSRVSLAEVEDAAFNLSILAGLLINARIWLDGGDADRKSYIAATRVLRDTAVVLPALWEEAYRALFLKFEEHTPGRNIAEVQLRTEDPSIPEQYADAIEVAKRCWAALATALADHQVRVRRMPQSILPILLDPIYPRHCALIEAADRSPLAVEKTSWAVTKDIQISQFAELSQSLLITAPAGFGKTSFCKYHALRDAHHLLKNSGFVLPIYVPLHQIGDRPVRTFADLFANSEQLKDLLTSSTRAAVPFRRIRLYLDGLDEIANSDQRRTIINRALSSQLAWPVQVIVTARDHVYDDYLAVLPRVKLSGFRDSEITQFVRNWLKDDSARITSFDLEIARHRPLHELMAVPLLATLLIGVFRKTSRLPGTRVELYEMCVDLLCGGWDLVKNIQRRGRFEAHVKLTLLKALAGHLHAFRLRQAELQDIKVALRVSISQLEDDPEAILDEVLQDGLLVRSGRVFLFSHFSFQEYLAAKNLVDPTGKKQAKALRLYLLGDDWWKDVIEYYIGLLDNPHMAHEWIAGIVRGMLRSVNNSVQSEIRSRCSALERALGQAYPLFTAPAILK